MGNARAWQSRNSARLGHAAIKRPRTPSLALKRANLVNGPIDYGGDGTRLLLNLASLFPFLFFLCDTVRRLRPAIGSPLVDYNHAMFFSRVSHHPGSPTLTTTSSVRPKSAAMRGLPPRLPPPLLRRPGSALPGTSTMRGGMSHYSYADRRVGTAPAATCRPRGGSVSSYGESVWDGYGGSASRVSGWESRRQLGRVRVYRTVSTVLPDECPFTPVAGAGAAAADATAGNR